MADSAEIAKELTLKLLDKSNIGHLHLKAGQLQSESVVETAKTVGEAYQVILDAVKKANRPS